MAERKDTQGMTDSDKLSEIYSKVTTVEERMEVLDDVVLGDASRQMPGLYRVVEGLRTDVGNLRTEFKEEVAELHKANSVRKAVVGSVISLISVLASLVAIISIAWTPGG